MVESFGKLREHLEKLHSFCAVAKAGSITQAARNLRMSQAALSHSIKMLEEISGAVLFSRQARGVVLTESGKLLFEFSKRFFNELERFELKLRNPRDELYGKLRVATHETLAIHIWPQLLVGFFEKFPKISVSITSGRVDQIIDGIFKGDYHLAVTVQPAPHPKLKSVELYADQMGLFAARNATASKNPALSKSWLTPADIEGMPVFTDSAAHLEQHLPIPTYLLKHHLKITHELTSFEAAIRLASQGLGIAALPERNAVEDVRNGNLKAIRIRGITSGQFGRYRICASYLKENETNTLLQVLLSELKESKGFRN